ncbi:MAG TPA: hypothetical protein PKX78_04275, partial [Candidatus Woesebacteria bacterium]|nr:hypothetical protein [Candidatus Woesebacteria bacterium]
QNDLKAEFAQARNVSDAIQQAQDSNNQLLCQLQARRFELYVVDGVIGVDLNIFIGVNDSDELVYVNLKGFSAVLAGKFVEFIRNNHHEVDKIFNYFDTVIEPRLALADFPNFDDVFNFFDRLDPNIPQTIDPNWK